MLRRIVACAALSSVACGGASGTEAQRPEPKVEPAESPEQLAKLFEREASGLEPRDVSGPGVSARVSASDDPEVSDVDGLVVIEVPIGTSVNVRCQLFPDEIDPGGTLHNVLVDLAAKVEPKRVAPMDVIVVGDSPAVFVDVLYHAQTERGKAAGEVKVGIHVVPGRPMLCLHDEPGYRKTFQRVLSELGASLSTRNARSQPSFAEVRIVRVGEAAIGFHAARLETAGDEQTYRNNGMMMIPRGETELVFEDRYTTQFLNGDDYLLRGAWARANDGVLELNVKLKRNEGKEYGYEGQVGPSAVQGTFSAPSEAGVPSAIHTLRQLARVAKKPGEFSVVAQEYAPRIDPGGLTELRYYREAADPPGTFRLKAGDAELTGTLDAHGLVEELRLPSDGPQVTSRRESLQGTL